MTAHLLAGTVFALAITGCQAARRFGGFVKVESEPSKGDLEIPPPAQRLASGKAVAEQRAANATAQRLVKPDNRPASEPSADAVTARISSSDPGESSVQAASASEPAATGDAIAIDDKAAYTISDRSADDKTAARVASLKRSVASVSDRASAKTESDEADPTSKAPTRRRSTRATEKLLRDAPTTRTASDRRSRDADKPAAKEARVASATKSTTSPKASSDKNVDDRHQDRPSANSIVNNDDADEVLDAFSSSSPEVQQQALRQLLTMAASNAKRSDQPSSIDELLRQAMASPVDLPDPRRTPSAMQTTRLEDRPQSRIDSETDATAIAAVAPEDHAMDEDQQDIKEDRQDVIPVSASSSRSERSNVARAMDMDDIGNDDAAVQNAVAKVSNALLSDEALFDMLIRRLKQPGDDETEAERHRREIMIRHLMVMSGRPEAVAEEMDGLTKGEQEFLRHQLLGLWTIIDPEGHPVPSRRFSAALPEIRAATKHLAASTDSLEVRSLAFCTQIEAYGQVKEFEVAKFSPNQQVLLYCEVDNFAAKQLTEGGFETHLQGSYAVYDESNTKIVSQLLPADRQVSRNYLRDYYIAYQMPMPSELKPGKYRLELTMEDINGKKYGQSSIEFAIKR